MFQMVHGTKGLWYEQSMVRIVYGTNSLVIYLSGAPESRSELDSSSTRGQYY